MANPHPNPKYQFKPGNPGGPGRPRGRTITSKLRDLLEAKEIDGQPIPAGRTVLDEVGAVIVREAVKGDIRFVQLLIERVEHHGEIDDIWKRLEELRALRGDPGGAGPAGNGVPSANGQGPGP